MTKLFKIFLIFIYLISLRQVNAANITGSNTINSDSTTQQVYNADDTSLTITIFRKIVNFQWVLMDFKHPKTQAVLKQI